MYDAAAEQKERRELSIETSQAKKISVWQKRGEIL